MASPEGVACSLATAVAAGASRVPARTTSVVTGPRVTTMPITTAAAASSAAAAAAADRRIRVRRRMSFAAAFAVLAVLAVLTVLGAGLAVLAALVVLAGGLVMAAGAGPVSAIRSLPILAVIWSSRRKGGSLERSGVARRARSRWAGSAVAASGA